MIVTADAVACIGAGTCVNTVPDVFELDEEGTVRILQPEVPESLIDVVEDAIAICPVEALALEA